MWYSGGKIICRMKKHLTWKNFNRVASSTQFLILIFGIIFTVFQIQDIRNNQLNRKNDLSIQYYNELNTSMNRQIGLTIEYQKPILSSNKGKFTEDQLDDYLGVLHDIGRGLGAGLLDEDTTCSSFSDLSTHTSENKEIQEYLQKIRKNTPTYFLGVDSLYNFIKGCS